MRVLIIEDEPSLATLLRGVLSKIYSVDVYGSGHQGLAMAERHVYDLIVLDLSLPDIDGKDVCTHLRRAGVKSPILVFTGRNSLDDKISLFDGGADDYVVKPATIAEIQARIRALLRRPRDVVVDDILTFDDLVLNMRYRTVFRGDVKIDLRRKEFELLHYLMRNASRVVTRQQIINSLWDNRANFFMNTIDVHMMQLRAKIDRPFQHKLIKTIHGIGYKLEPSPSFH